MANNLELSEILVITDLGGYCPVQAEGTIDGDEFYFRARGNRWSMTVTRNSDEWYYEEPYGETEFSAGWMELEEARLLIHKASLLYMKHKLEKYIHALEDIADGCGEGEPDKAGKFMMVVARKALGHS